MRAGLQESDVPEKLLHWPPVPLSESGWQQLKDRFWTAPMPNDEEVPDAEELAAMHQIWNQRFGDRRQQLAIIGIDLDQSGVTLLLDSCLLTDAEMALEPSRWTHLPDPFEPWRHAA